MTAVSSNGPSVQSVPGYPYGRHWDTSPHAEQRVFNYIKQPTDNVDCSKIGRACADAIKTPGGDSIDQGLALLRELHAHGYGIVRLPL